MTDQSADQQIGSSPGGVSLPPPLSAGRRAVLFAVRQRGDASVGQVASDLGITVSGTRQHLTALVDHRLVDTTDIARPAGERGRRQLSYHTTELADALFPKAYGALTNELLGYLDEENAGAVDRLFERRRTERIANARIRLASKQSLGSKVQELARILDEDGYLATTDRVSKDRYRIIEHNCAIATVARRYGQACTSEIEFIRALLPGASVTRTHHMVAGDRHCAYDISASD
jgi:DeoR family transcriptional regulator, suf operon transcriptional repressor